MNEARLKLGIKSDSDSESESELEEKENKINTKDAAILDFKNVKCFKDFKEFVLKLKSDKTQNASTA